MKPNCAGLDWEDIHPSLCPPCPMRAECLNLRGTIQAELVEWGALNQWVPDMDGVWGGVSFGQTSTDALCDTCSPGKKIVQGLCNKHYQRTIPERAPATTAKIVVERLPKRLRVDEPTMLGYNRAVKAGHRPTTEQADAAAAYKRTQRND
ncbi:hypothetical protein LCGC14_2060720 [marine sediment metagenome]|uniref:Uncharacterized protein n=1 Tax=marine sediment metagenome TaxID=412755 RepID=A0A0F9HI74_9ZZZZ